MGALLFLKFHQKQMERFGYNDEGQEFPGIILAKTLCGNILSVGKYVIDAKSIMGIFSLDLSNPLQLGIENWKEEYAPIVGKNTCIHKKLQENGNPLLPAG